MGRDAPRVNLALTLSISLQISISIFSYICYTQGTIYIQPLVHITPCYTFDSGEPDLSAGLGPAVSEPLMYIFVYTYIPLSIFPGVGRCLSGVYISLSPPPPQPPPPPPPKLPQQQQQQSGR